MRFRTLELEASAPIARITLRRGPGVDADGAALLDELDAAAGEIRDDPAIRVVLLSAAGNDFGSFESGSRRLAFRSLELLPQPVIACVRGRVAGVLLELTLACDIRVADTTATFSLPNVAEGAMPALGGTQRLPRLIGRALAAEMILLGADIDSGRALTCGLVNYVTPPDGLEAKAEALAARIIERGPLAVAYAKEAMVRGGDMPLDQALRYETDLTVILQTTADRAEGVRAFLEKRPPRFEGR